ncbi:hypothetical protein [Oryza sativa Japonica Group]|uniref:Uncharacterized protein P0034C09.6 n=1 Tax=Oryza sativa subsp. japonica TaxID=39947 RepID=Q8S005_ORYSJ|nr:hypothetical protein [Oryza sativa Japonica Group]
MMLFGALAASFALSFFLITIFICPRALRIACRRRDRPLVMEQEQQQPTLPRFGLDTATITRLPSFIYVTPQSGTAVQRHLTGACRGKNGANRFLRNRDLSTSPRT